jgi:crotonobetainyl-CoA:carnitine CoA-transferase CaiB-like acyl-CoA transferase
MQVLEKIHVLTLATNLPGPLAVARLRSMGAQVLKIEPPGGDLLEHAQPNWYRRLHDGIRVARIDLKEPSGRQKLEGFLGETDLLITSSRPSALTRLGLGWDDLHGRYPRLAHVAIVGNPAPEEEVPGHDLLYQAGQGLVRPPDMPRTCLADLGGALEAVIVALQLVLAQMSGEPGTRRSVSLAESASWFAEPLRRGLTVPGGMLGGGFGGYHLYRTKQGWIAVAALEPHFQKALAGVLGLDQLEPVRLQEIFLTRTASEWVSIALQKDLPLAQVAE